MYRTIWTKTAGSIQEKSIPLQLRMQIWPEFDIGCICLTAKNLGIISLYINDSRFALSLLKPFKFKVIKTN